MRSALLIFSDLVCAKPPFSKFSLLWRVSCLVGHGLWEWWGSELNILPAAGGDKA